MMRDAGGVEASGISLLAHIPALRASGGNSRPYRRSRCLTSTFLRARGAHARTHARTISFLIYLSSVIVTITRGLESKTPIGGAGGWSLYAYALQPSFSLPRSLSPRYCFSRPSRHCSSPSSCPVRAFRARSPVPPLSFFCSALISPHHRVVSHVFLHCSGFCCFFRPLSPGLYARAPWRPRHDYDTYLSLCTYLS